MKRITLLLSAFLLIASSQTLSANFTANLLFAAKLTGDQETPPVTTNAYGVATFILNATRDTLCISVTVRDLSSAMTLAHIHQGSYGLSGPPVFDLTPFISGNRINAVLAYPVINDQIVGALIARQFYINVHTSNFPDGEIRGQIELETDFHFKASLSGQEIVPPANTNAIGHASFDLHKDYMYLKINAQFTGLSGPITTAQLHYGQAGINGPEVAWLDSFINGNTIQCEIPVSLFIYDLIAGNIYINVNTDAHPIGEIRGQIYLQSDLAFDIRLDGLQEVPPTPTSSTGSGTVTFSPALDTVYFEVVYDSLLGSPTLAHFHEGIPGVSGPPVVDVSTSLNGNRLTGMATSLPPDFIAKCLLGTIYLNVHSSAFASGEIRGQVNRYAYEGFTFSIDGAQETPPNPSPATGSGFVAIDPEKRSAHYRMVVNDLTGPITEVHFHHGAPGVAGPPVFDLTPYFTDSATNVSASNYWTDVDFAVPFNATFADLIMNEEMYVNFHTAMNIGGEVRGNILKGGSCFITTQVASNDLIKEWTIYPVPVQNKVTIAFTSLASGTGRLDILDISGRIVHSDHISFASGQNQVDLELNELSAGVYLSRLSPVGAAPVIGKIVKE